MSEERVLILVHFPPDAYVLLLTAEVTAEPRFCRFLVAPLHGGVVFGIGSHQGGREAAEVFTKRQLDLVRQPILARPAQLEDGWVQGAGSFSVERLMEFLTDLGQDIEIRVKPTRKHHGQVSVFVAA